ncbi:myb-like protein D [Ostrinia furnacalis]|uniref:myb-like protein D n=1 Tax=Ostrinia furnacalis TaxID=93504 RepID=UPI00103D94BF|nr:myb-like protein D [Ostrinia furnacalis]
MDHTFSVPRAPVPPGPGAPREPAQQARPADGPFMNSMDEISYWICTKQAPCLYNYDNVIKRQCEEAHCSKPKSVQSITIETPSPKKKKKRKLSLLDDESVSTEKQQNVYFETSQRKSQQTLLESCKSDTLGSDLDFNIKNSSIKGKSKKARLSKSNRTIHKKNKIATSTPKVTGTLRRSLRKAQRTNNNGQNNHSFETYNCEIINGSNTKYNNDKEKSASRTRKLETLAGGDQSIEKQNCNEKTARTPVNGQFDDLSDVSGFTANYIRSTKIHSAKRNLRNKGGRNIIKESQRSVQKDDTLLVCVNKSVNTGLPKTPMLNCSTDSSQNIVNLVTLKSNDKSAKVNKSTSLLKFVETKNGKKATCNAEDKPATSNLNISFQSKSSATSRYPKRTKNSSPEDTPQKVAPDKRRKISNSNNKSERKENPEDNVSRTRSGKCIGLSVRQAENSVLVLSNSMEQVSSLASLNVATPSGSEPRGRPKRRRCANKQVDLKKPSCGERPDSLRDKSGFAACFSDSDEDNVPLKERKFFC